MNLEHWLENPHIPEHMVEKHVALIRDNAALRQSCNNYMETIKSIGDQRDLFMRRAQLAAVILRDDEQALGSDTLELIACAIWPPATITDPTQIPTPGQFPTFPYGPATEHAKYSNASTDNPTEREPDFYVTPTWGEREGYQLVSQMRYLWLAIEAGLPEGFSWGDIKPQYMSWLDRANKFVSKFGTD